MGVKQPVYIRENVYAGGATAYDAENEPLVLDGDDVTVDDRRRGRRGLPGVPPARGVRPDAGSAWSPDADLERVRFVDAEFEERDGSPAVLDADLVGERKTPGETYPAFPVAQVGAGSSRIRVW